MKEIGEKLLETRESIGISIEEAAEDLKMRPIQLENIEKGNMEAFKDLFSLKYFIRDYSKYLGLDYEDMIDEYNEYLFDYTSKLSLDDIKKAKKKMDKKGIKKIASPYTVQTRKIKIPEVAIYIILILTVVLIGYFAISFFNHNNDDFIEDPVVINVGE